MAKNPFRLNNAEAVTPARTHFAITPSDTVKLPDQPKAIYCQAAGNAAIVDENGSELTYALTAGQILPLRATQVKSTGTTATLFGWL